MTDPDLPDGFAPTESFETGRVTAVAADDERVVLGTETGDVEIVSAEDRTTVEFDAPITDLAVGNRVYALAGGAVAALSTGGTRVWSVELPEAEKLAALPEADVLGAVTDDDRLLGFDGETGGREFAVERPHANVTDDPGFFGTDGAFVLVAWSFLAVRNLDGSERFDLNLDGAIESAGIVADTVVVSLKDERVVGVDATTGEKQWERELAVTDLPDRGDDVLLFTAEGKLVSLAADGTYAPVEDLPSGDVYPTSDGNLFCAIADGTVGVYCSTADPGEALDLAVRDGALVPGEADAVDLRVRNAGDQPVAATLRADGEGVELRDAEIEVDLAPDESVVRSLGVESLTADGSAALAVSADGDHLASLSLTVAEAPSGSLDAALELDGVTDGTAEFALEVTNDGDAPVADAAVSPGGTELGTLVPGESATVAVEVPFDPGSAAPVAVRAEDERAETEAAMPDAPDLEVEASPDGFVDVRVENPTDVPVTDELVVSGDCFDARVARRVELRPDDRLVLALRPDAVPESASVEAALAGLGLARSVRFGPRDLDAGRDRAARTPERRPDSGPADRRGATGGRETRDGRARPDGRETADRRGGTDRRERTDRREPAGEPRRRDAPAESSRREPAGRDARRETPDRSGRRETGEPARRETGESSREATPETTTGRESADEPARHETGEGASRRETGEGASRRERADDPDRRDRSAESENRQRARDASPDALGRTAEASGPDLSAERSVETTDPVRTQGVRERVEVTNEGGEAASEVRASFPDKTVPLGTLAHGESATFERHHAFAETGEATLPAGTVAADDGSEAEIAERTLSVAPAEFAADVTYEPTEGGYRARVSLTNRRDVGCDVTRIGAKEFGVWDVDLRVPPGETVEWTREAAASGAVESAVETAVEYAFDDAESSRWGTLGRISADDSEAEGIDALAAEVGEETRVSGGYGSVVLAVENTGGSPVADVSVEADGEAVSDLMYAGRESVERLAPGESFTHFVDVEADGPEASLSVALSAGDGEAELTLRGPAPADEDDWSDEALADWRVERAGSGDERSHVASEFEEV